MIKKHFVTCSVMLVLLFIAKVFFGPETEAKTFLTDEPADFDKYLSEEGDNAASLNFADEELPLGDKRVQWKMDRSLEKHHFDHLQTKQLHYRAEKW
ncbi:MAG: lytic transglycosylase domain-containing protein, partial [Mucilaginibacter polytrichastri]|nr:lytic transglycosylase domain-containing protein [Mucilaginibacter polytrichastri]